MRSILITVAALAASLAAAALNAQQGTPAGASAGPSFEVASIRPADESGMVHRVAFTVAPTRLTVLYYSVGDLIEEAYRLQDYQLQGPTDGAERKAYQTRYDIEAVTDAPVTDTEMRARLQTLLADRFQVTVHWETRRVPMYRLERQGANKMKPVATGYPGSGGNSPTSLGQGTCAIEFTGPMSMSQLANRLTGWATAGKPVVDQTGLPGYFVIAMPFQRPRCAPTAGSEFAAPTLAGALKDMGLKLTPAHDPIQVLVVDHVGAFVPN